METNRRNAIKLGAAVAVASVIPMTAGAAQEDGEIERLFHDWRRKREYYDRHGGLPGEIEDRYFQERPAYPEIITIHQHLHKGEVIDRRMDRSDIESFYQTQLGAKCALGNRDKRRAALEAYEREDAAVRKRTGLAAAEERDCRLLEIEQQAFHRLMECEPRTLHGVALKLIAAGIWAGDWDYSGDHISMLVSAIGDANRLTGGAS